MYKIFLFVIFVFFSNTTYANLTQEVTLSDGTTVVVGWAHQEQLDDWVNNAQNASSYEQLAADMYNGWIGHSDVHVTDTWVACDNWASLQIVDNNGWWWGASSSSSGWGWSTPPPPPAPAPQPTTTTSTTNWWSCSSYISSWSPSWSSCEIQWTWSSNWSINCKQTNNWSANTSSCGTSVTTTTTTCVWWNCTSNSSTSCDSSSCPWNAPRPPVQIDTKTVNMWLSNTTTQNNWAFANNLDTNDVRVKIWWTTNQNRPIVNWWTNGVFSNFIDTSNISSDLINNSWQALNFESVPNSINIQWSGQNFYFDINNIKSRTPIVRSDGKIRFNAWSTILELNNVNYKFKKPFTWYIEVKNPYTLLWDWKTILWTQLDYKLNLLEESNLDKYSLSNYNINDFSLNIEEYWDWLDIQNVSLSWSTLNDTNWTIFSARINTSSWATELNNNPWLQINLPVINYSLAGWNVSYYLSKETDWDDSTPITSEWEEFKWVKILWNLEWDWKQVFTWQEDNFSSVLWLWARAQIRQNAYENISTMNSGQIADGVLYIEWDYTISWNVSYETLVVKNWNIIISGDLNTSNNKLWLIVLKDNYSTLNWYNDKWNVYVKPNVRYINASIYADGWLISVWNDWLAFPVDNSERTYSLKNQLYMKWTLSTRNTIGWSILAWWKYILPWWTQTDSFDLAMQYDLNYIRRWSLWWDTNSNWLLDNGEYSDAFIIEYNPNIQLDPPKLFAD